MKLNLFYLKLKANGCPPLNLYYEDARSCPLLALHIGWNASIFISEVDKKEVDKKEVDKTSYKRVGQMVDWMVDWMVGPSPRIFP